MKVNNLSWLLTFSFSTSLYNVAYWTTQRQVKFLCVEICNKIWSLNLSTVIVFIFISSTKLLYPYWNAVPRTINYISVEMKDREGLTTSLSYKTNSRFIEHLMRNFVWCYQWQWNGVKHQMSTDWFFRYFQVIMNWFFIYGNQTYSTETCDKSTGIL